MRARASALLLPQLLWVLLVLVGSAGHAGAAGRGAGTPRQVSEGEQKGAAVVACMPDSCLTRRTTWAHMLTDLPSCVAAKRSWWSRHPDSMPITLITQLSVDRLPALKAQCASWAGPLAAAVYLPLHNPGQGGEQELSPVNRQKIQAAISAVNDLFKQAEAEAHTSQRAAAAAAQAKTLTRSADISAGSQAAFVNTTLGGCQLRVALLYEVFAEDKATALYPVNALRNYARLLADTPMVANIDVDMLPSASLSRSLLQPPTATGPAPGSAAALLEQMEQERSVFVLPAFETTCGGPAYADQIASGMNKSMVWTEVARDCLSIFRGHVAPACHNATDFPRWFKVGEPGQEGLPDGAYAVEYQEEFEPWFISSRTSTEWFDVRYRGYGKNKIEQVAHTASRGARFFVHPHGFLVHRPHTESQARKHFLRVKFKSRKDAKLLTNSLYEHVEALWAGHRLEIKDGSFQVMVDQGLSTCLDSLPWWKQSRK